MKSRYARLTPLTVHATEAVIPFTQLLTWLLVQLARIVLPCLVFERHVGQELAPGVMPSTIDELDRVEPVYETLPG